MRKIIAKRLAELFTAPHYNLVIEVTMDDAMAARAVINNVPDKVSFNDMVIKACAMALKNIQKNSQWKEDAITINHHVNMVLLWLLKMV
jgi:pyruvate dehydrogenase E2 component (dihydrolipoamide acetyltransferase)